MQLSHRFFAMMFFSAAVGITTITMAAAAPFIPANAQTASVQSASGRITAVQGNTFTLQTAADKSKSSTGVPAEVGHEALIFTIDQGTSVDGKIAIGADANVTYREQDGNNIAVSVRIVKQPS